MPSAKGSKTSSRGSGECLRSFQRLRCSRRLFIKDDLIGYSLVVIEMENRFDMPVPTKSEA
jgi:hypothetical protein